MLEWIGLIPLLGLTGNWRGYRMGGKAIGGANMSTDMKKKFEAARAAGNMDQAQAIADKAQKFNDDKKAEKAKAKEAKTIATPADDTPSSNRLKVLEQSLAKKEAELERRFDDMFADRRRANGQPINDKRNGAATFKRWEKKDDAIRKQQAEIEKTKNAIEREKGLIKGADRAKTGLPSPLATALSNGNVTQWRKYPNTFFVKGVEKARIVWDEKKQELSYKYLSSITDPEQRKLFAKTYNEMKKAINP